MNLKLENIKRLLTNGSGYSIKSWFLYGVTVVGIALLSIVGFVLVWDVVADGKVDSSVSEIAGFVTAISGLFVAAGLPKIVGEIMEKRKTKSDENNT